MLRHLKKTLATLIIVSVPFTAMSAPGEDIHREVTEGKIAAAQVIYLEAEIFTAQALLERELAKASGVRTSQQEGKIIASMVDYIERSLDKLKGDLENSSIESGTDLTKIEKEIESINKLISEINS